MTSNHARSSLSPSKVKGPWDRTLSQQTCMAIYGPGGRLVGHINTAQKDSVEGVAQRIFEYEGRGERVGSVSERDWVRRLQV